MEKNAKIYVAGHRGLVGSAIWKNLQDKGYTNLVGRTHKELDLLDEFERFIGFFKAGGRNVSAKNPAGETLAQVLSQHRLGAAYISVM